MSDPKNYRIRGGGYRAEVSSSGAALRVLEHESATGPYRLTESWPENERPPLRSGTVLAPWPNRIRDGHFYFDGIEHQLALTEPERGNAVHGFAWHRDWVLVSHNDSRIEQALDVGLHKGWPYQLRLTATHEVGDDGLTVTHTATNVGGYHSPFGLGVHPYVRAGDAPVDECTLRLAAGTRLPLDPGRGLPNAYSQPVEGTEFDFTAPRPLRGVELEAPYSALDVDVDGRARHDLRGPDGRGVQLWAGREFAWLQVFTAGAVPELEYPGRGRALALEPMTCPPDAFNLGIDLVVLQPGETWTGRWGLTALPAA
ncbi:aldose 1-epimerase family protein [Rhodococcus aetherivorans]|uniref:aldose 1-epimerase family protein n=1 Tax=Rhodococcus aetherivorans TaxID=191292 RepID=UPI000622CA25|nr:aldose 1-epimerase family protein [Rhodococcus aetherivorans]AKE88895.1 aldose epimerase [Rhodococcus aetherivorans]